MPNDEGLGPNKYSPPDGERSSVAKEHRKENSPWLIVLEHPSRRLIIDVMLELVREGDEGRELSKAEIARRAGIKRQTLYAHIELLVKVGIIEEHGEEGARYSPNPDSEILQLIGILDSKCLETMG